MTNLEAIKATVAGYPLSDNAYIKALMDRGITSTDTYGGKGQAFELAQADLYITLATGVNISEGGYSISVSDRDNLVKIANSVYQRWGQPLYGAGVLKVKAVNPW
jgi:hypothetical protein